MARSDKLRQLLVDIAHTCGKGEVWLPCHENTLKSLKKKEAQAIKCNIKSAIHHAKMDFGSLPFLSELSDGWKDGNGNRYIGISVA